MAFVNKYSKIGKLKMVHVGNALGLNQNPNIVNNFTQTLMISLDDTLNIAGAGVPSDTGATTYGGTTRTWSLAGSWANLSISTSDVPTGSTVDQAYLVWDTGYGTAPQPTQAFIQTAPINFITPDGVTHVITPTSNDSAAFNSIALSADVTSILNGVISGGIDRATGKYQVSNVPMSIVLGAPDGTGGAPFVGAGWSLVIFYTHPTLSYQSETLYIGNLQDGTIQTISGFYTPDVGIVKARIYVQSTLSSANTADNFLLQGKFVCGPNNQHNPPFTVFNFLSSIVCDYLGNINYNSSFGNNNVDPSTYNQGAGLKAEYTLTNVPADNYVPNSTRSTTILSSGDGSSITSFGLEIQVNQAYFAPIKTSNKAIYEPGDTVTYTIPFTNTGGSTATNVVFTDTLPSNLTFVPNSLTYNGVTQPGYTLTNATMPNIPANGTVTVTFKAVTSVAITQTTTIPNTGWLGYNFISDPLQPTLRDSNITSTNIITVFNPTVTSTKTVSKSYGDFGDTLTYTIVINNPDTNTYTNLLFQDTIPNGTTFVANSLTINGASSPSNPNTSINLGTLPALVSTTVTFQVKVNNALPSPNPIPNNSTQNFIFTDNYGNTVPSSLVSNTVTTQINRGTLSGSTKSVNKTIATIGDTLIYTVTIANNGNISSDNVVLTDTIPPGTSLVANSVTVNGVTQSGASPEPPTGVTIGTVGALSITTVTFSVVVNTLPTPNPVINNSTTTYTYSSNPSGPVNGSGSVNSNSTSTLINLATFNNGATKTANKAYAKSGDIVTYTVVLNNTGNATANNVIFVDTIPNGTTFVANSVTINGIANPGSVLPPSGFTVGNIPAGATYTLTFNIKVTTIPSPNPIINIGEALYSFTASTTLPNGISSSNDTTSASTLIQNANLSTTTKSTDKFYASCGDIITYTITIPNTGNITAQNIIFTDTIPVGTTLVPNSVNINGVTQTGASPAPPGINIGNIAPGATSTIIFQVAVNC